MENLRLKILGIILLAGKLLRLSRRKYISMAHDLNSMTDNRTYGLPHYCRYTAVNSNLLAPHESCSN